MPARVEYRCWSCRRDVPASDIARFPRSQHAGGGMGLCRWCAAEPRRRAAVRLSAHDAESIRAATAPARDLAARYGLTVSQVRRVRSGDIEPLP